MLSEEEIRPDHLMKQKEWCIESDRSFLLERKDEWTATACPACDSNAKSKYGTKNGFNYEECDNCKTVYTTPRPSLNLLHRFYKQSKNYEFWNKQIFPATEDARKKRIFRPRAARLIHYCQQHNITPGTLMEIGAAFGTFCEEAKALDFFREIIAVEPTPDLAETCRSKGFHTVELPIELITKESTADTITAFEVIEHLFDPRSFINKCSMLLRPNGLLVLTCPNARGFDTLTLKLLSSTFDHEHLNYFNPKSLELLVESCGLEVLDVQTPGELDADIVRNRVMEGKLDIADQPFLQEVLVNDWDSLGRVFQAFLSSNKLSSHMWLVAKKKTY
jgi:2-polyprenyl-3-methyl-5-hydroxy-6-metoxy-1,4-benzoquinol methylase